MIKRAITSLVFKLFFPGLKVHPKPIWVQKLKKFGETQSFFIKRGNENISCIKVINPKHFGRSRKIVIFAHPISKKAKYWFTEGNRIKAYIDLGYDIVLFDFNGFGESDRIDFFYWKDAESVIHYMSMQPNISQIVLHGISFGSFQIIRATSSLPLNSVVVLENTSRSLFDYWKRWFVTRNAIRVIEFMRLQSIKDMDAISYFKNLERDDLKFIFIVCDNDRFTPADEGEDLASYVKSDKEFVIFKGDHFDAPKTDPDKYVKLLENTLLEDIFDKAA